MTKNCIDKRQRSRISEGRDHECFTEAKNFFTYRRSVKIGLSCDGMFVDIQCCPLEITLI